MHALTTRILEAAPMTRCTIDWTPLTLSAWTQYFNQMKRSTLLQHFPYAQSERVLNQIGARHGVILIDDQPAGIVQLGEVALLNKLIHVVTLDRGPLWFDGFDTPENITAFFTLFAKEFPRRFARKIRILAELEDTGPNRAIMAAAGLQRVDRYQGYETIWVDLSPEPDRLRARLDGNWRRFLSKAERTELTVVEDWSASTATEFLDTYAADKKAKNYSGPSERTIKTLLRFMAPRGEALIMNAMLGDRCVASLLILLHGRSATYQVGWNLAEGRKVWAHHLLFWHAFNALKARGISNFDLGGVNDESAQGIKRFKEGMGGCFVKLVGFYR